MVFLRTWPHYFRDRVLVYNTRFTVQYTRSAETYKSLNLLIFLRATRETKPLAAAIIQQPTLFGLFTVLIFCELNCPYITFPRVLF